MILRALEATLGNFAIGLAVACLVAFAAVTLSERSGKSAHDARRDVDARARERGRP